MRFVNFAGAFLALFFLVEHSNAQERKPAAISTGDTSHLHHVAVFGGATTFKSKTKFTLGLDYGYRIHEMFSVGLITDFAFTSPVTIIVGPATWFNPYKGLRFVAAPAVEFFDGVSYFLFRIGTGYDFHFGHWSVGPTYNADFVKGKVAHVYGISVGYGF